MATRAPSLGRILVAAGFALSCFGLLLFLWIAFGGPVPLGAKGYRITAYFPEGTALANQTDVRIGGVSVGRVVALELAPPQVRIDGKDATAAELEIDPDFAPISADARAIVRQKTLQGEAYVELASDPGGAEASASAASLPPVALGAAANLADAGAGEVDPVPDGGSLGAGQVSEATQFDEVLDAADPETRRIARRLLAGSAGALRRRGADLSDGLGNVGPFLEDAARIVETVRSERRALGGAIRDTGGVLEALAADDRELAGAITGTEQTFGGLADAAEPLAETVRILPTFEREADLALERLDRLVANARPVVAELLPVALDVPPTLRSLRRLSPKLHGLFDRLDPLLDAAGDGLPALRGTLAELGPAFDALDPFLANLNPVLRFLSAYRERTTTFFSNPPTGLAGSLPKLPGQPAPRHSLRVLGHLSAESLAVHPVRLDTNRGNAYFRPNGYLEGLDELFIPSFDCKNTDYTETSQDPDEDERLPRIEGETYASDGQEPELGYDYTSCGIARAFPHFGGGRAPNLPADR